MIIRCTKCKKKFNQTNQSRICWRHEDERRKRNIEYQKKRYHDQRHDYEFRLFGSIRRNRMIPHAVVNSWIY